MPPYLTTPLLATQLRLPVEALDEIAAEIGAADADEDVEWLLGFLGADRLACYCLYQSALPRAL
jgi:hypothetical protein